MLTFLDLFAGIGGFSLGLERAGMRCIGQVENDPFCLKVLARHWSQVRRMEDVHYVEKGSFDPPSLICGGPPCQPISSAGKGLGSADDRWLWPEALRIVAAFKPDWVLFENPPRIKDMGLCGILSEMEALGYEIGLADIPACAVGAPSGRQRLWIMAYSANGRARVATGELLSARQSLAQQENRQNTLNRHSCDTGSVGHANGGGQQAGQERGGIHQPGRAGEGNGSLADAAGPRLERPIRAADRLAGPSGRGHWDGARYIRCADTSEAGQFRHRRIPPPESRIQLVDARIPERVARIRAVGNSVVPQVVEEIGKAILEAEAE